MGTRKKHGIERKRRPIEGSSAVGQGMQGEQQHYLAAFTRTTGLFQQRRGRGDRQQQRERTDDAAGQMFFGGGGGRGGETDSWQGPQVGLGWSWLGLGENCELTEESEEADRVSASSGLPDRGLRGDSWEIMGLFCSKFPARVSAVASPAPLRDRPSTVPRSAQARVKGTCHWVSVIVIASQNCSTR